MSDGKSGAKGHRGQGRPKVLKVLPRVYNAHNGDAPLSARYCGRGSPWGNPFIIGGWWPAKGRRMTRDDVCDRFECEVLPKLDVSPLRGLDLECYCAPQRCHCDSIIRKANPGYEETLRQALAWKEESRIQKEAAQKERAKEDERKRIAARSAERAKLRAIRRASRDC